MKLRNEGKYRDLQHFIDIKIYINFPLIDYTRGSYFLWMRVNQSAVETTYSNELLTPSTAKHALSNQPSICYISLAQPAHAPEKCH